MSKYRIRVDGKTYEMEIELVSEKEELSNLNPRTVPKVTFSGGKSTDSVVRIVGPEASRQTHNNDNLVLSPMPGTIIKLMAKQGDNVARGDVVMILEAMKMENEIHAQKSGIIKEVCVKEGDAVPGGAPLFEMNPEE